MIRVIPGPDSPRFFRSPTSEVPSFDRRNRGGFAVRETRPADDRLFSSISVLGRLRPSSRGELRIAGALLRLSKIEKGFWGTPPDPRRGLRPLHPCFGEVARERLCIAIALLRLEKLGKRESLRGDTPRAPRRGLRPLHPCF